MKKEMQKRAFKHINEDASEFFEPPAITYVFIPNEWKQPSRWAWIIIVSLTTILFALGLPLRYGQLLAAPAGEAAAIAAAGITPQFRAIWLLLVEVLLALSFTIVAVIIFVQKSGEYATYILSLSLFMFGTTIFSSLNAFSIANPDLAYLALFSRALSWILLLLMLYIFPDGRFRPGWTRWLAVGWVLWTASWLLFPELPHNPTHPGGFSDLVQFLIYLVWFGSGIAAQIIRYRKYADASERQQTKWVLYGFLIASMIFFLEELPSVVDPTLVDHLTPQSIWYQLISTALFAFSAMAVPITMAISIQHKRLWEVDFIINRSLVYGSLTAFLVIVFFGLVLGLQELFNLFIGEGESLWAVVFSVGGVALLFQPARLQLLRFIDRKLYGINLHYRRTSRRGRSVDLAQVQFELGKYIILEPLGRGGMAEVYKGRHRDRGYDVAIKLLLPYRAVHKDFLIRFEREAKIMSALKHPNIVRLYDYGKSSNMYYMVMELFAGGDLGDYLKSEGRLSLDEALPILIEIAAALDYAHEKGVVHRDVKPSNVMLHEEDMQSALTDFGIVKLIEEETGITQTGIVGTFDYISPEQIQALKSIDGRADVYAMGVMTYQILTGDTPFDNKSPGQILLAHMNQPPPDPRLLIPGLSGTAALAIGRAMAKDREKRFITVGDFVTALAA